MRTGTLARSLGSIGLVLVAGCGLRLGAVREARPTTADALLASMAARREAVTSLRARVRLRSGLARVWTRQAVLVQRPTAIRIDVLSPFGLALALGTEGHTLWAFPPQQGVRYEGPATAANVQRLLGTPLAVRDLVDVFLGVAPARPSTAPPTFEREGDDYVLTIVFPSGIQRLAFAVDTHELHAIVEQVDGRDPVRVTFADYHDGFARTVDVAGAAGAEASIAFDEIEPNVVIDPVAFTPPAAPRVAPLERVAAPS